MSGNGKDIPFTSPSTEDEEQAEPVKCWVCEQDLFEVLDQASKIALVVANAFCISHFSNLIQIQELERLYTKDGALKGWMVKLMGVIPHQDVKHRLLGRIETLCLCYFTGP